ncbi:MAG: DUF4405 domain-containing protein [Sedimentisphaerales bacterium]|nr:DUF4405 domain-containing protein [Sedimentisphaerales bacterium]
MKRMTINFLVDLVAFIDFLVLIVTGFIIKYILPPGSGGIGREISGGRGREEIKRLLSMTRHEWGDIHFYMSVVFVALMLVHLILHWSWIKCYFKSQFGGKNPAKNIENCPADD